MPKYGSVMVNVDADIHIDSDSFAMQPLQASDLDALAAIWSDPEVTQFLPCRGVPISREQTERSLQSFLDHWRQRGYGVWAIVEKNSSQMVGYCGLRYLDELNEVEVLYGLARSCWGKGMTTKAVKATVFYGFNATKMNKLIVMTLPDNFASRRVAEKVGFQYEKQVHIFGLEVLYYSKASPLLNLK